MKVEARKNDKDGDEATEAWLDTGITDLDGSCRASGIDSERFVTKIRPNPNVREYPSRVAMPADQ